MFRKFTLLGLMLIALPPAAQEQKTFAPLAPDLAPVPAAARRAGHG